MTLELIECKEMNLWTCRIENKHLLARLISKSTRFPKTFKEEIEKLRVRSEWLDHVCAFYGTESASGTGTFLLMEVYEESMQTRLQREGLTSKEIQKYGSDIICGVGQLHNAGIICGVVEPSTILIDEKERAHISIYGINSIENLPADVSSIGHNYAAPETWNSNENGKPFSKTSDVWSMGCTLLFMCSGMMLWDGLSDIKISEYVHQKILPLHLDGLKEPLFSIISGCLQYKVEKRPTLNEIQEKFLGARQEICKLAYPLRDASSFVSEPVNRSFFLRFCRNLQKNDLFESSWTNPHTRDTESGGDGDEDYGEDDSHGASKVFPIESDVISACKKGSLEDLEKLLKTGAKLCDEGALCFAVSLKRWHDKEGRQGTEIVQSLLQSGIDPSCKDDKGQTPLHIAASMDDIELLKMFIQAEVDVNILNIQNETPLYVALKNHAGLPCIEYLIHNGAKHTLKDNDGNNGLHIAAQAALSCKNLDAMLKMLNSDASPAVNANYRGYTLKDLLKRLPTNMISQELKSILEKEGISLSLEGEPDQSDSGPHGKLDALNIANLDDAHMAGGNKSLDCTLILTEGRTANKFATSGKKNGKKEWAQNEQVKSIFKALGLELSDDGCRYVFDKKSLRYGHVLMMMDQDSDGNHIRGLLIHLFNSLCPELLELPLFLHDFRTYLYKVTNVETNQTKSFRFLNDYQAWSLGVEQEKWTTQYLKGIASNSDDEVKQYFEHFEDHIRYFVWHGILDSNYIRRAFSRSTSNVRKKWILEYEDGLYDNSPSSRDRTISYHEFIQKELVPFFHYSVKRAIPSMMDGFKISQRKIMFTVLEKEGASGVPLVNTLATDVSRCTAYHHGETSLASAIISMAQDFCGTNNLNLLTPEGQFGSRNEGPDVNPETRYLKVNISPIAHLIFRTEDMDLLDYDWEDGKQVQPKWYFPIFPLILVNGARGIASGFSTSVLNYDANVIIRNLERLMDNMQTEEMMPSYRDFKGTVAKVKDSDSYTTTGIWELDDNRTTLTISELPVSLWYNDFEKHLRTLKRDNGIESFEIIKKAPSGEAVHWYKILLPEAMDREKIESTFKLKKTFPSHIYLYNAQGCLQSYTSPDRVLHEFYTERLKIYEKRKELLSEKGKILQDVTAKDLWRKDLQDFKEAYSKLQDFKEACSK